MFGDTLLAKQLPVQNSIRVSPKTMLMEKVRRELIIMKDNASRTKGSFYPSKYQVSWMGNKIQAFVSTILA